MQLRIARLCLDCEEVYGLADTCPVCASTRYAFLSTWLPVEERRKWRGRAPQAPVPEPGVLNAVRRALARWFGDHEPATGYAGPRTRRSDDVPRLDFDDPANALPQNRLPHVSRPLAHDRKTR